MVVGLFSDISGSLTLVKLKNILLYIVCPLETIVSILYWSIVSYDRSLLIPKDRPVPLPLNFDISVHLMPTVYTLIDYLFFSPPFSLSIGPSLLVYLSIAVSYMLWVEKCYQMNKFYAYPILAILDPIKKTIFYTVASIISFSCYIVLKMVHPYALPSGAPPRS